MECHNIGGIFMKKQTRILSIILCLSLIFSLADISHASGLQVLLDADFTGCPYDALQVASALEAYFSERYLYLNLNDVTFTTVVDGIVTDENRFRDTLTEHSLSYRNESYVVLSAALWDTAGDLQVEEYATYRNKDGSESFETIQHTVHFYYDEGTDSIIISSDGYRSEFLDHNSCSYVADPDVSPYASYGSSRCLIQIATNEVGNTCDSSNHNKYGDDLGQDNLPWCAIFVWWCAKEAGIPSSIIPYCKSCTCVRDFFANKGSYYSFSGSTTPQAGDLFFQDGTSSSPNHMGIIRAVDSDYIYVIDGNYDDAVCSRKISRSSSSLVGFARPSYSTSSHTAGSMCTNASYHWHECTHCGVVIDKASHSFSYDATTKKNICSVCGYSAALSTNQKLDDIIATIEGG